MLSRRCPSCDASIRMSDRFCPGCGADLLQEAAAPKESPQSAEPDGLKAASASSPQPTLIACRACRREVSIEARVCPHCGVPSPVVPGGASQRLVHPSRQPQNPGWMAVLSLLIPGLGQVVVGQVRKGFAVLGGSLVLAALSGFVLMIFIWPAVSADAYLVAKKLDRGESVEEWEFFPRA